MYIAMGAICFIVAGALSTLQARRLRQDGALQWACGWILQGAFWILVAFRGIIADSLSIVVAHTCLAAGYSLLYAAVREFQGRPYHRRVLLLPPVATFALFSYFSIWVDNLLFRVIFISLLSFLQVGAIVLALLYKTPVEERRSFWLTGFAFLGMALFWLNRLIEGLTLPYGQLSALYATSLRNVTVIVSFGTAVLSSIGFVFMIWHRADEARRRSEERYRTTLESIGDGFFACDADWRFVYVNATAERILGIRREEVLGKSHWDVFPLTLGMNLEREYRRAAAGEPRDFENFYEPWARWFHSRCFPREGGGMIVYFEDITARKAAEVALTEAERRYRELVQYAPAAIYEIDFRGKRFTSVNEAMCLMLGRSREELLELNPLDMMDEESKARFQDRMARWLRGEKLDSYVEYEVKTKDGRTIDVILNVTFTTDEHGEPLSATVVAHDITDRKLVEEALRESEARFRSVLDGSRDVVYRINIQSGRYEYISPSCKEVVGFSPEELMAMDAETALIMIHADDRGAMQAAVARLEETGQAETAYRQQTKSGGYCWLSNHMSLTRDAAGVSLYRDGNIRDITRQKQAEEALKAAHAELEKRVEERTEELRAAYEALVAETKEREEAEAHLRQAQKMEALGTLSGGIAHDFNNILAAIIGFAELLAGHAGKSSREERHLNRIIEAGIRGRELVRQMLAFSRKAETEMKPLVLSTIIKETVKLVKATTPTTIAIRTRIAGDSRLILGDPTQIQQVIVNLCTNGVHAMREKGGTLDIDVFSVSVPSSDGNPHDMKPGPYMKLAVRDTGTGIPPEIMDKIFDPFFTTKKVGEGTGLGLSVVHGIVRQLNGYIFAESKLGEGSTFTVYFPEISGEQQLEGVEDTAIPTGHERILLVDDEEALVEMGEDILAELGYDVTSRMNGKEALLLLKEDPSRFDLVLTDVTMPEMTGVDLAREVLSIKPGMPIIMCTGHSHLVDADKARSAGVRAFAMKPMTKREIAKTIRQILDE
jgi:PAS domain S-box-containing protein